MIKSFKSLLMASMFLVASSFIVGCGDTEYKHPSQHKKADD
jgi:hypothetical protein